MASAEKDMEIIVKLKRFCFLGSFEPVYTHLGYPVKVDLFFPIIEGMVKEIRNEKTFLSFLVVMLKQSTLVRRDESIFVYATYLAGNIHINRKTALRVAFTSLIGTEEDLFNFCRYTSLIGKLQKRKVFSRTVRKAITSWYEIKTPDELRKMWLTHRGLCGFTHCVLMKLCHITDQTLGSSDVAKPFFVKTSDLAKDFDALNPVASGSNNAAVNDGNQAEQNETRRRAATPEELVTAISKLRTTKKNHDALKIIRKYKLPYNQVPSQFLTYGPILTQLLPTMTHFQIFRLWRKIAGKKLLDSFKIFKLCKSRLENKTLAEELRMHPIHFLMHLREIGVVSDVKKVSSKKVDSFKMEYLNKLYLETFKWSEPMEGMHMHITVNLQTNYKKKFLRNHPKLNYYEACLALCLGYSRRAEADIFHWYEDKMKLKQIIFNKDAPAELAFRSFDVVENPVNNQRLVTPIMNALTSPKKYDVFLCIVPTAGRGNPRKNSDFLAIFLDKYRESKKSNTKFIILNLLKHKRSMTYSLTRNENLLEICGLDEHTPDLIQSFATHRFE